MVSLFVMSSCEKDDMSKSISIKDLDCNVTIKNVTTHGGNDGEITVTVLTGNGDYIFTITKNNVNVTDIDGKFTNLSAGDYNIKVEDAENKQYTKSVTLSEPFAAPVVETLSASVVSVSDVTLNGKVNPNSTTTSSLYFEYGTTTSYGTKVNLTNVDGNTLTNVSTKITSGLNVGTTYHYRLVATNSGGTTNGNDMTFSINNPPTVTTSAIPTNYIFSTNVTFVGSVNPQNNTLTNIYVKYGTTTSYGKTVSISTINLNQINSIPTLTQNVNISITDGSLTPKTLYHYKLVADYNGGTVEGNDMTFTTWAMSPISTVLAATNITSTTATLNGNVNTNGVTTTNLYFEYGTSTSYGTTVSLSNVSGTPNVNANITNLTVNTTYHYRLVAINEGGTTTSDDMTFTTKSYNIGDELYGGIIFKLPNTNVYPNEPGLIVKETDLYSSPNYYPGDNTVITINNKDWRLPEYNELLLMYNTVNSSLTNPLRTDGFLYWTKTKDPNNSSKRQIFNPNNTSSIIYYSTTGTTELIRLVTTF